MNVRHSRLVACFHVDDVSRENVLGAFRVMNGVTKKLSRVL